MNKKRGNKSLLPEGCAGIMQVRWEAKGEKQMKYYRDRNKQYKGTWIREWWMAVG